MYVAPSTYLGVQMINEIFRFEEKFKSFLDQWECREKQFKSLLRVKELEILYHQAKLDQQRKAQEVESSKSNQLTRQVTTFSQTEAELRSQLNIYVEKFKQVSLHMSRLLVWPLFTFFLVDYEIDGSPG